MDDKYKSQYYLLRSKSLFNNGEADFSDVQKAAEALSSITSSSFEQQAIDSEANDLNAHLVNTASTLYEKNDYLNSSDHFENAYTFVSKRYVVFVLCRLYSRNMQKHTTDHFPCMKS